MIVQKLIRGIKMAKNTKVEYSFWIGIFKTLKNSIIMWAPAIIAFFTNVPVQYAGLASVVLYLFKNWYETTTGKKLL